MGLPRVGISIGDFNGIGPEIILKTLSDQRILNFCTPVIYGSSKILAYYKNLVESKLRYETVTKVEIAKPKNISVFNCWKHEVKIEPGVQSEEAGQCAVEAFVNAVNDLKSGSIDALVTAPFDKKSVQNTHFKFKGHTEYLANEFGKDPLMFMVSETLKVALVTDHVAVADLKDKINEELILHKLQLISNSLKNDFGIQQPKIAVLGVNPHAGDGGVIGKEDEEIVKPALEIARNKKILAFGPFPADGFFGSNNYQVYDGVLAIYHDQGLIPFKTLSFGEGVNFTGGLPVVRTSPDHGVAYDIAGKGIANESSFRTALFTAIEIWKRRAANGSTQQKVDKVALPKKEPIA